MTRFAGGGGKDRACWGKEELGVRSGIHYVVGFLCRFVLFLLDSCEQERGTRKRDEVEQYSSRPAREYRTEGESRRAA